MHELGLFGTTIVTSDNVMTLIGNGKIFADTIQNFSALPVRAWIAPRSLPTASTPATRWSKANAVLAIPNVVADPPPQVSLLDLKSDGPLIAVRPYTANAHYWQVHADTNEAIIRVAQEAGWPAPTPVQITRVVQG